MNNSSARAVREIPVRVVRVYRETSHPAWPAPLAKPSTAAEVASILEGVNHIYRTTGVQLVFDPKSDFETRRSDILDLNADIPTNENVLRNPAAQPQAYGWRHTDAFTQLAQEKPLSLTIIVHTGGKWVWNEGKGQWEFAPGLSHATPNYVCTSSARSLTWAHEIGHLLGLRHTGPDIGFTTVAEIQAALDDFARKNPGKDPLRVIDEDLLFCVQDTAPNPGDVFWRQGNGTTASIQVNLPGKGPTQLTVSNDNLMGGLTPTLTDDQVEVINRTAIFWLGAEGGFPRNARVPGWLLVEAEDCKATTSNRRPINTLKLAPECGGWTFIQTNLLNGASLSLRLTIPQTGRYRVWLLATVASDYGRFACGLDDTALNLVDLWCVTKGNNFDGQGSRQASGRLELGIISLQAGEHVMTFQSQGHHRLSQADRIGLDAFLFEPVP